MKAYVNTISLDSLLAVSILKTGQIYIPHDSVTLLLGIYLKVINAYLYKKIVQDCSAYSMATKSNG